MVEIDDYFKRSPVRRTIDVDVELPEVLLRDDREATLSHIAVQSILRGSGGPIRRGACSVDKGEFQCNLERMPDEFFPHPGLIVKLKGVDNLHIYYAHHLIKEKKGDFDYLRIRK